MDTTTPDGVADAEPGVDDGPLPPGAEPDAIDEDGDDASPVCLRCFAPLLGAPTRCPSCAAPASRSATLGPSAGGGVDVGGTDSRTLPRGGDGHLTAWAWALVWGLGVFLIPWATASTALLASLGFPRIGDGDPSGSWFVWAWIVPVTLWTLVCGVFVAVAARRGRGATDVGEGSPPPP